MSPTTVARGGTVRISGSVAPSHPGGRIALQDWVVGHGWRTLGSASLSPSSTYSLIQRPTTAGKRQFRVCWLGDVDHVPNQGPAMTLTVT